MIVNLIYIGLQILFSDFKISYKYLSNYDLANKLVHIVMLFILREVFYD